MLVQLVGPPTNYIFPFMPHPVLYYYLLLNILFQQFADLFILFSTKTINFSGYSLSLIDIKSVRSVSYDFCCLKSNDF